MLGGDWARLERTLHVFLRTQRPLRESLVCQRVSSNFSLVAEPRVICLAAELHFPISSEDVNAKDRK